MNQFHKEFVILILIPLLALLTASGCDSTTYSVTGIVTKISSDSRTKEVTLTFKDETEMPLKNGNSHAIFKNV